MKFKNITTGVVLEAKTEFAQEQLKKNKDYQIFEEKVEKPIKKTSSKKEEE